MQADGRNTRRSNKAPKGLADGIGPHGLAGIIGEHPVVDWRATTDALELCVLLSRMLNEKTDGFGIEVDYSAAAAAFRHVDRLPAAVDVRRLPNGQESAFDVDIRPTQGHNLAATN